MVKHFIETHQSELLLPLAEVVVEPLSLQKLLLSWLFLLLPAHARSPSPALAGLLPNSDPAQSVPAAPSDF